MNKDKLELADKIELTVSIQADGETVSAPLLYREQWDLIVATLRAYAVAEPVADQIIGQIEDRFPNWRSYRDLIDCIDCTLHHLRHGAHPAPAAPVPASVREAEGWRLVPLEPTLQQHIAAMEFALAHMASYGVTSLSPFSDYPPLRETTAGMYRSMVSAAPSISSLPAPAAAPSSIMQASAKAAKTVEGWSDAKREYADRVSGAPAAAPTRE